MADLANRLLPTLVPRQLLGGARVGRCHGVLEELALAFAMVTHGRLGSSAGSGGGGDDLVHPKPRLANTWKCRG